MKNRPGIFNDVIGPIMRGPSSSHTAAAWRAAKMSMDILNEPLAKAIIDFDKDGAWAPNYREQGTTVGIDGGLLGIDMADDRIKNAEQIAIDRGISITYEINTYKTTHVNTFRLTLSGLHGKNIQVVAVSLGGGSVRIEGIDGFDVKINGASHELLLFNSNQTIELNDLKNMFPECNSIVESFYNEKRLINLKFSDTVSENSINQLIELNCFDEILVVNPVVPIVAGNETELPFSTDATQRVGHG